MKRLFFISLFCVLSLSNYASRFGDNITKVGFGIGPKIIKSYEIEGFRVNNLDETALKFDVTVYGATISYFNNMVSSGENRYGSGGVSNKLRFQGVSLCYNFPILNFGGDMKKDFYYSKARNNVSICVGPMIGSVVAQLLYNDRYYDSDVAYSWSNFEYGGVLSVRYKYIVLMGEFTNKGFSTTLGVSIF